ncbi:MAG: sigma-70 family RNA polymerase sigma factor [Planctomycetaceae bacterium]
MIDRSLGGDTTAFGSLVDRYQDRLYGTLMHLLGSPHDALDVSQDAFVLAFQNLTSFRGDSAFYSWLFRIAYNASVSYRRKRRHPVASIDHMQENHGLEVVDGHHDVDPTHDLISQERQQLVRQALDELPEEFRTVLILKELEGLSYEEIAETIGCPVGTVRSRIHRARGDLKEKLGRTMKHEQ